MSDGKVPLHRIDKTGATTGDVITFDGTDPVWDAPSGGGGGYTDPLTTKGDLVGFGTATTRIPVGSDGEVLTADSTAAEGVAWAAPSGGGGGASHLTVHDKPTSAHSYDDEFEDDTSQSGHSNGLASKWSRRVIASGAVKTGSSDVQGGLFIDGTGANQPSGVWGLEQSVSFSGDFTIACRLSIDYMSERQMIGIHVVDSSGDGWCLPIDSADVTYLRNLTGNATGLAALATPVNGQDITGRMARLVLRRISNVFHAGVMKDDVTMPVNVLTTSVSDTRTIAKIGIGRYYSAGSGGACRVHVDYFRVTEP